MDDKTYRQRDLWLKAVTAAVVVVGAGLGLWKYLDSAERSFRQPYWERQVSLYFEATSAASLLASSENDEDLSEAEASFWRLNWGPLALVEDRSVEKAMVSFGNCLKRECPRQELQQLSLTLAHACRRSLGDSWNLKLESLEGRTR